MPILCQNAFTKSLFFQHGFDHPPTPPLLNNVKKTARLVKRHIPNYSPLPCSTRLSKLLLRGNPGGSLALQHPLKIRSEPTISYLFCLSNLECGDGDPTLPIVEVGHRPIDGEGETHEGHQGPHQSVHQGQGPVRTDSFYNPKLSNLRFLTGTDFYETLRGYKGRTKIYANQYTLIS